MLEDIAKLDYLYSAPEHHDFNDATNMEISESLCYQYGLATTMTSVYKDDLKTQNLI